MSVKDIIEEIGRITDAEIRKINEETDKEIKQLKDKNNKIIEEKKNNIKKAVETKAVELKNGIVTRERLSMRNRLLAEKQALVSGLFDKVKANIVGLDSSKTVGFYTNILKNTDIPEMDYELLKAEGEKNLDQESVRVLSEKSGVKIRLSQSKCKGESGFILKSDYLELDFRIDAVLKNLRTDKESEIVKILFG